jgi:tRNA pseudouridine38-40 synthase
LSDAPAPGWTAEPAPLARIRLLVAYDGTGFRGLAPNTGVRTVVGELRRVLEPLVGFAPELTMSGRTDAGVHAWGQVLSADLPAGADLDRIQRAVNSRLGPEVVVREIAVAGAGFSARYSAASRSYRYTILNRAVPEPFLARWAWWVPQELSVEAMSDAAHHLTGEHDFSSFCRRSRPPAGTSAEPSLVRRVTGARWLVIEPGDVLRFEIEGSAFCHQMVRSIVGLLVAVGRGKRGAGEVPAVLAARDRSAAEQPAPPHGLVLWHVDYPG